MCISEEDQVTLLCDKGSVKHPKGDVYRRLLEFFSGICQKRTANRLFRFQRVYWTACQFYSIYVMIVAHNFIECWLVCVYYHDFLRFKTHLQSTNWLSGRFIRATLPWTVWWTFNCCHTDNGYSIYKTLCKYTTWLLLD